MLHFLSKKDVRFGDGLNRRDFLKVGAASAGAVGVSLADLTQASAARPANDVNCILLFLVGGPSQLDTWDLKPDAPSNIRGPFRPIRTNVPGIDICEHFPLMAQRADRFAIVRSVHHKEAPIHETGHQLMQTGHLFRGGMEYPHYGAVLSHLRGSRVEGIPPYQIVPAPIGSTGVSVSHGQGAGFLGSRHEPLVRVTGNHNPLLDLDIVHCAFDNVETKPWGGEKDGQAVRDRYGRNTFGQSCLLARRLVEQGVRLVTVNMFDTVFNEITWDCHADGGSLAVTLDDYKDTLCPMFDRAYTALLDDLEQRGMLDNTLVLAMGEFGRTPQLNPRGGRDHWPGVWSVLFAGGGVRGGQVIGSSDKNGAEPRDQPVDPAMIASTVYKGLGIDRNTRLPGPENSSLPLIDAAPIEELFRG